MQLRAGLAGLVARVWLIAAILIFDAAAGSSAAPACAPVTAQMPAKLASVDDGPRSDPASTRNDPRCDADGR